MGEVDPSEKMADDGSVYVPIVLVDGESKITGVKIHPSAKYTDFNSGLSSRLGISPNQIKVHIVARKKPNNSPGAFWESSITGKLNFSASVRESDCFFVVVVKRIQEKPKRMQGGGEFPGHDSPNYGEVAGLEFVDDDENLQILQIQREKYATIMKLKSTFDKISNVSLGLASSSFPRMEESSGDSTLMENDRPFCEECAGANGEGTSEPFHLCKYDAVTEGFRSKAGPVARPCILPKR